MVPTMGYLHNGHLSLVHTARHTCDMVVLSIFVNPTQFGPNEDFELYPRDLRKDMELADGTGVDIIFAPAVKEMYPCGYSTYIEVTKVSESLCGATRPGHFRGVATIVNKLFNIIRPDKAFFGQKDFQQILVIKRMVHDLNMNIEIVEVPIIRETDGLAMSSRNAYLSPSERKAAIILYQSLNEAQKQVAEGERNVKRLKEIVVDKIGTEPLAKIDYVEILAIPDLREIELLEGKAILALAVKFGNTRLIDNTFLECNG